MKFLIVIGVVLLGILAWLFDNEEYDRDLESQHFQETGLYWKDVDGISRS